MDGQRFDALAKVTAGDVLHDGGESAWCDDWFLAPWWHVPFSSAPVPLLTLDPLLAERPEDAARPYEVVELRPASLPDRSIPSHFMSTEAMTRFLEAVDDDDPIGRREPYRLNAE